MLKKETQKIKTLKLLQILQKKFKKLQDFIIRK